MTAPTHEELGFDPNAMRAKYRAERDKRVCPDGLKQYVALEGSFAELARDPWAEPLLESTAEAEAAWVSEIVERGGQTTAFGGSCTPGYYNNEGTADEKARQGGFFFGSPTEFAERLEAWREAGDLAGLSCR